MKRFFTILAFSAAFIVVASAVSAMSSSDKHVSADKLPQAARDFVAKHFPDTSIVSVKTGNEVINSTYEVSLADGTTLEFTRSGEWTEIKRPEGKSIPAAAVPARIAEYVDKNYPANPIREIERDRRGFEVTLRNGAELTFDHKYDLVGYND